MYLILIEIMQTVGQPSGPEVNIFLLLSLISVTVTWATHGRILDPNVLYLGIADNTYSCWLLAN